MLPFRGGKRPNQIGPAVPSYSPHRGTPVDVLRRLFPFMWPYRRRFFLSAVFGIFVALLWGADLAVVFPIVKILFEKQSVPEYVAQRVKDADEAIAKDTGQIEECERVIAELRAANRPETDATFAVHTGRRLRALERIAEENRKKMGMVWAQQKIVPLLPESQFHTFLLILGILCTATALKGVCTYTEDVLVGGVAESTIMRIRRRMLRRALRLDYETLSAEGSGGLMSRFTFDSEQLSTGISLVGARLVREPLKCLACCAAALWINWRLTGLALLFMPLLGFALYEFGRRIKRAGRRMMESMSRLYQVLNETFDGLRVVIAFGSAGRHQQKFDQEHRHYYNKAMRVVQLDAIAKPMMEILALFSICIAMLPGAYLVLRQQTKFLNITLSADVMSSAELAALYAMLAGMLDPCRKMSATFSRLRRSSAAADRIFQMLDAKSSIRESPTPTGLPRLSKSIEFRDVVFRYGAAPRSLSGANALANILPMKRGEGRGGALDGVNLTIQAGEVVAIVGQNGCGKSTLMQMLPRFFDPQSGDVLIDGVSLRDCRLKDLRAQIGVVTQETVLFDGTIADNLRYANANATAEQLLDAAIRARVLEIAESRPLGFNTRIGEKGNDLSGGQRQRIALGRAILRDPALLILDEATSAADSESETKIHEALREFAPGRTVLIITHSLTTSLLDLVTRIVVMDQGKVLATGSHDSLLASCPLYARLFHAPNRKAA